MCTKNIIFWVFSLGGGLQGANESEGYSDGMMHDFHGNKIRYAKQRVLAILHATTMGFLLPTIINKTSYTCITAFSSYY